MSAQGAEKSKVIKIKPHYHGHRDRLRQKLFESGGKGVQDYELLELLLFPTIPRRDIKPLCKELIAYYGNLQSALNAEPVQLKSKFKLSEGSIAALKTSHAIAQQISRDQMSAKPILGSWQEVLHYCTVHMAHEKVEQFRVLFLDAKNRLIADEVLSKGTINQTAVYPREIMKRAIELGTVGLILMHNHPSGDLKPSKADINMTEQIVEAADVIGIKVHDHLIISSNGHASFKSMGLL